MRRFLPLVLVAFCLSCGSDVLGPVTTIDGHWSGIQNGYSMSLFLTQTGSDVSGSADIGGIAGFAEGTTTGTFNYPNLELTITVPNVQDFSYKGTVSSTEAKISGKLNGSGFTNLELDLTKKQ